MPSPGAARCAKPEIRRTDVIALSEKHSPLDSMIEFADISRPGVIEKQLPAGGIKPRKHLAVALRILVEEIFRQQGNVLTPFTQRRQMNLHGVQTKKKVFAKASPFHLFLEICVRRR